MTSLHKSSTGDMINYMDNDAMRKLHSDVARKHSTATKVATSSRSTEFHMAASAHHYDQSYEATKGMDRRVISRAENIPIPGPSGLQKYN